MKRQGVTETQVFWDEAGVVGDDRREMVNPVRETTAYLLASTGRSMQRQRRVTDFVQLLPCMPVPNTALTHTLAPAPPHLLAGHHLVVHQRLQVGGGHDRQLPPGAAHGKMVATVHLATGLVLRGWGVGEGGQSTSNARRRL